MNILKDLGFPKIFQSCSYAKVSYIPCPYEKQTYSKNDRDMFSAYEYLLSDERPSALVHRRHFKTLYRVKITKRLNKAHQRNKKVMIAANLIKW